MATISVTIPTEIYTDIVKILQAEIGDGNDGNSALTGSPLFKAWMSGLLSERLKRYRSRTLVKTEVAAELAARQAAEATYATEKTARIAAEVAAKAAVDVSIAKIT